MKKSQSAKESTSDSNPEATVNDNSNDAIEDQTKRKVRAAKRSVETSVSAIEEQHQTTPQAKKATISKTSARPEASSSSSTPPSIAKSQKPRAQNRPRSNSDIWWVRPAPKPETSVAPTDQVNGEPQERPKGERGEERRDEVERSVAVGDAAVGRSGQGEPNNETSKESALSPQKIPKKFSGQLESSAEPNLKELDAIPSEPVVKTAQSPAANWEIASTEKSQENRSESKEREKERTRNSSEEVTSGNRSVDEEYEIQRHRRLPPKGRYGAEEQVKDDVRTSSREKILPILEAGGDEEERQKQEEYKADDAEKFAANSTNQVLAPLEEIPVEIKPGNKKKHRFSFKRGKKKNRKKFKHGLVLGEDDERAESVREKSKAKKGKEKITFSDRLIRVALRTTRVPARALSSRLPALREDILRSNLNLSPEGVIAVSLLFTFITIPIVIVGMVEMYLMGLGLLALLLPVLIPLPLILGLSVPKVSASSRSQALENELPYLVGYITVLAGGGISPIVTIKRISKVDWLFPAAAREARRILLDIEVFGLDAISALDKAARYSPNKKFSDFIGGYIAVLKTGGDAVSYLESKLKELFAYTETKVRSGSEFIGTMAEAYIITTVVMGISLIILWSTQNLLGGISNGGVTPEAGTSNMDPSLIVLFSFMFVPVISIIFIVVIGSAQTKEPFTFEFPFYVLLACLPIPVLMYFIPLGLPQYTQLGIGLAIATAPATIIQMKYVKQKKSVEAKLPNFLRDISEIRKTGIAPEKTIEQLAGRQYAGLTPYVKKISTQLSWGTPIRTVLQNFSASVRSWVVKAMAFLLLEVVDVGGGSSQMFTNLADFTEKNAQLEKERRSLIKPYLMIPYVGAIMIVASTAMMLYFINPPGFSAAGIPALASPTQVAKATNILLLCSFFQAWVMGFVAGKMGEGSVADGFKHATLLVVLSLITVYVSTFLINTTGGI